MLRLPFFNLLCIYCRLLHVTGSADGQAWCLGTLVPAWCLVHGVDHGAWFAGVSLMLESVVKVLGSGFAMGRSGSCIHRGLPGMPDYSDGPDVWVHGGWCRYTVGLGPWQLPGAMKASLVCLNTQVPA